ncbi:MAG: hypothetical protein DWP94_04405 [Flavobacterium sp.]|nr:MAG: hypothetical protein DWP94_04405 [Flavobacterium sp.]
MITKFLVLDYMGSFHRRWIGLQWYSGFALPKQLMDQEEFCGHQLLRIIKVSNLTMGVSLSATTEMFNKQTA